MSYKISQIEGIGEAYARQLEAVGVNTVEQLLEKCSSKKGRTLLADETGISEKPAINTVFKIEPMHSTKEFLKSWVNLTL